MNKDIQALIDREAEKYTKNQWGKITEDNSYTFKEIYEYCKEDYAQGFKDVLSLFKWNQVTDGYPDDIRDVLFMTTKGIIYMGYYDQMECQWSSISGERFYTISITKWMEKP